MRSSTAVPRAFLILLVAALLATFSAATATAKKPKDPEDLFNPLLGIDYSHWLGGAILEMASEEEVEAYLALASDEEAEAFIAAFWERRSEGAAVFAETPRDRFEARAAEADKRFSEGTHLGRRTDRGKTYILYGPPASITFPTPRKVGEPAFELWTYPKDSPKGLDGKSPQGQYRFIKLGDLTVFYTRNLRADPRLRNRNRND